MVGNVTRVPAAYLAVPPPPDVSTVVPRGSTAYRPSFHAVIAATALMVACGTGTAS
jgi:hypothetical protein